MAFTGLKGEFLLVHGLRVQLRERVRGAAERGVHRAIDLVQARGHGLPLLPHPEARIESSMTVSFLSPIRSWQSVGQIAARLVPEV